jgi:hypothetical protein
MDTYLIRIFLRRPIKGSDDANDTTARWMHLELVTGELTVDENDLILMTVKSKLSSVSSQLISLKRLMPKLRAIIMPPRVSIDATKQIEPDHTVFSIGLLEDMLMMSNKFADIYTSYEFTFTEVKPKLLQLARSARKFITFTKPNMDIEQLMVLVGDTDTSDNELSEEYHEIEESTISHHYAMDAGEDRWNVFIHKQTNNYIVSKSASTNSENYEEQSPTPAVFHAYGTKLATNQLFEWVRWLVQAYTESDDNEGDTLSIPLDEFECLIEGIKIAAPLMNQLRFVIV